LFPVFIDNEIQGKSDELRSLCDEN